MEINLCTNAICGTTLNVVGRYGIPRGCSRRSYGAGEWGRNRVRIFPDPKTGLFQIEWRENGRRLTRSLKHRDWRRAKRQADQFAAGFIDAPNGKADAKPEPLTLERLFDIYGEEVTPTKGAHSRGHDRAAMHMFLRLFGRNRDAATLSQRDWDRFIRERRAGRIGASGRPVSDRTVEYDLKFLIAVLNWAAKSRDERGRLLLDRNPLRGLRTPTEKNPTRIVLAEEEYRALLEVSRKVDWRFHVALVLAHETGQRIARGRNPGRKSPNYIQDCTICVSCRHAGPCWTVPRKREKRLEWRDSRARAASFHRKSRKPTSPSSRAARSFRAWTAPHDLVVRVAVQLLRRNPAMRGSLAGRSERVQTGAERGAASISRRGIAGPHRSIG